VGTKELVYIGFGSSYLSIGAACGVAPEWKPWKRPERQNQPTVKINAITAAAAIETPAMAPAERLELELAAEALLDDDDDEEEEEPPPLLLLLTTFVEVAPAAPAVPISLPVSAVFAAPLFPVFDGERLPLVAVGLLPTDVAPYCGAWKNINLNRVPS